MQVTTRFGVILFASALAMTGSARRKCRCPNKNMATPPR
jgi:hypothetical protein